MRLRLIPDDGSFRSHPSRSRALRSRFRGKRLLITSPSPPTTTVHLRPRSMSNELIIDDNDRQFSYKGEWEIYRSTTDQQWMRTAHSTWEFDATATLTFTGV
ncbi:hypothetical protein BJ165DRAFT_1458412 [Panaeolus papilionaceus]|nr:hypothetical protein BJ165DRAFT_1458412 [Panaeolus papilionaceus]